MKTLKYLFLGLFMAAFTACIVSSCKDDDDESNQSIEGYWVYDDDDDDYMEMWSLKGGKIVYAECNKNDKKDLPLLKNYIDDNWGRENGNFVNNTGLYIYGGKYTYEIKGSQIYITHSSNRVDIATFIIKGNKLYLDYDGDKDSFTRYSK